MDDGILIVQLQLGDSNESILDLMRQMKACREDRSFGHVVCTVGGFSDDSRELYEIAEVRAFCRRLVGLGFISYLDPWTSNLPNPPMLAHFWGATEVWLCGEGRMRRTAPLTKELLDELTQAILEANEKAEAALGPLEERGP
jgi:hypothetical protein